MQSRAKRERLVRRLRLRTSEIQAGIFARVLDLPGSGRNGNRAYVADLEAAATAALRYVLEDIEAGGEENVPIPPEIVRQAQRAAREGVGLDEVLRQYAAGNKVLEEFILAESEGIASKLVRQILSEQGLRVDRILAFVAFHYRDEVEQVGRSAAQQRGDRIAQLLEHGSPIAPPELGYDFERWQVGAIFVGPNAAATARRLGGESRYQVIYVPRQNETAWVWLGSGERLDLGRVEEWLLELMSGTTGVSAAVGEPRRGLSGWRQTHYEARLALPAMPYQSRRVAKCRDVLLDSAAIRDPWLAKSLVDTYLAPLDGSGTSGTELKRTLRAYFEADQTSVNAAISLGIERRTVERRLRRIESILGQQIKTCAAQLQVALSVEELLESSSGIAA